MKELSDIKLWQVTHGPKNSNNPNWRNKPDKEEEDLITQEQHKAWDSQRKNRNSQRRETNS